jgi:hypothetical protein
LESLASERSKQVELLRADLEAAKTKQLEVRLHSIFCFIVGWSVELFPKHCAHLFILVLLLSDPDPKRGGRRRPGEQDFSHGPGIRSFDRNPQAGF